MSTDTTKTYQKFKTLATQSLQSLSSGIIVKVKSDYIVFGRYTISPTTDGSGYYFVKRHGNDVDEFTNSRNALAYCILEYNGRIEEAQYLLGQDKRIQRLEVDIDRQSQVLKTTKNADRRMLMADLLTNNVAIRSDIKIKLNDTIELAKYYQQKGFDNETARTSNK